MWILRVVFYSNGGGGGLQYLMFILTPALFLSNVRLLKKLYSWMKSTVVIKFVTMLQNVQRLVSSLMILPNKNLSTTQV